MVLVDRHYASHEVIMVHLDLQVLGDLVELASCGVLAIHHHAHHLADFFLKVDPNGH